MKHSKTSVAALLAAVLLAAGCSTSPPKPPVCDGSDRKPVNQLQQPVAVGVGPVAHDTCSRG